MSFIVVQLSGMLLMQSTGIWILIIIRRIKKEN